MKSVIAESATKEDFLKEYKTYPTTMGENVLEEKPFYESRILPIFFEVPLGSKVLDVGCNDGTFIEMLQRKRHCDVTGIDISDTALEEAKKKGLNVMTADVENLPFEDETFDVITCMEVLSHLFDPKKAVKEMRRVLKKNGILLGSCPHKNLESYVWDDKRLHRRYFEAHDLHELITEDFDRLYIQTLNGANFAISMKSSFLANQPAEMLFKAGKDSMYGWDAALQDRSILRCWFGFTQGPGDVYYRMSGFADKMQKLGAETHYDPYNDADLQSTMGWCQKVQYVPSENRFRNAHIVHQLELLLKASDLSVFQITSSRDILLFLTTARKGVIKKPMLAELDDWIFDLPPYNSAAAAYHPNSDVEAVAYDQLKLSDGVITSTQYLKEKLQTICPDKPIYVIKNSLDFEIWDNVKKRTPAHEANPELIRIGYTGCGNHSGDMELVAKAMEALLDEFPNLEFLSPPFPSLEHIRNPRFKRFEAWAPLSIYPQVISDWEMDIGLAPLRDNETNRSKSNLRWLEYSALKVPTIASRVYPFQHSIKDNKDGILVGGSAKDWYDAIKALIIDKVKREQIGQAAYKTVKGNYSMDDVAKTYLSVLKSIKQEFLKNESAHAPTRNRKTSQRSQ